MADADWKARYFDSLRELELEEQRFRALESTLRRIVSRLCTAARGQDARLDVRLNELSVANSRNADSPELEQVLSSLRDAIAALDDKQAAAPPTTAAAPAPAVELAPLALASKSAAAERGAAPAMADPPPRAADAAAAPASERWSQTIEAVGVLLRRLAREDAPDPIAAPMIAELGTIRTDAALAALLLRAADVLRARSEQLARERNQATALLTEVTSRLDEVSTYLSGIGHDRELAMGDAETLNRNVVDQVNELSQEVSAARDLAPLQALVGARLETIAGQVREFRAREESRFLEQTARGQRMHQRIAELEGQTRELERSLQQEQLRARLDPLTGIPNRAAFDERLTEEISRFRRFGTPVSVLVWDIDHFKRVNDSYGHRAGDRVLREVAKCFAARLRSTDVLARFGGEEFVMLLIGTKLPEATRKADSLREAIETLRFHFRGTPVRVTISCGVTELRDGDDASRVFDRADAALYRAKSGGRNVCVAA
jgi:diguanylate cyclase